MRRVLTATIAATAVSALLLSPAAASDPTWEPLQPFAVTGATTAYSTPSVAVAPGGAAVVAWGERVGDDYLVWAATRGATGDWTAQQISQYDGLTPTAAIAADGAATVVWSGSDGVNPNQILARTHTLAGGWFPIVPVAGSGKPAYRPVIAASPSGSLTAAWVWDGGTNFVVQAAHSTGTGWSDPQTLTLPGGQSEGDALPALATDSHGTTTVAWGETIGNQVLVRAARAASGADFGPSVTLSPSDEDADDLQVAATDDGATAAWLSVTSSAGQTYRAASFRRGRWWPSQALDAPRTKGPLVTNLVGISLAGSDDVVHAMWTRYDGTTAGWQLVHAERRATWSPPRVLPSGPGDATAPAMASLPDGEAVAVWMQTTATGADVLFSRSGAGGDWTAPVPLGPVPPHGFGPGIGIAPERTVAAWPSATSITTRSTVRAGPSVPRPRLSRPVRVGNAVTCRAAVVGAGSLSYAWRFGHRVVGRHGTYVPKPGDLRHRLRCSVTAASTLGAVTRTSTTARVRKGRFAIVRAPQVRGVPRVGKVLEVTAGRWSPKPAGLAYLWRRGHIVVGRTKRYTPVAADRGHPLRFSVIATKRAYHRGVVTQRTPRIR